VQTFGAAAPFVLSFVCSWLEPEEHWIIMKLIEGMIIKYESRRWNKAAA